MSALRVGLIWFIVAVILTVMGEYLHNDLCTLVLLSLIGYILIVFIRRGKPIYKGTRYYDQGTYKVEIFMRLPKSDKDVFNKVWWHFIEEDVKELGNIFKVGSKEIFNSLPRQCKEGGVIITFIKGQEGRYLTQIETLSDYAERMNREGLENIFLPLQNIFR
ncbi:MAG: hypothetical protein PHY30_00245 [Candidatus Pacebacteria bacterium]|nr:hypothetical protein [Candidatus Paceibacterota bacterium]